MILDLKAVAFAMSEEGIGCFLHADDIGQVMLVQHAKHSVAGGNVGVSASGVKINVVEHDAHITVQSIRYGAV